MLVACASRQPANSACIIAAQLVMVGVAWGVGKAVGADAASSEPAGDRGSQAAVICSFLCLRQVLAPRSSSPVNRMIILTRLGAMMGTSRRKTSPRVLFGRPRAIKFVVLFWRRARHRIRAHRWPLSRRREIPTRVHWGLLRLGFRAGRAFEARSRLWRLELGPAPGANDGGVQEVVEACAAVGAQPLNA
jgi:hypothetical protein